MALDMADSLVHDRDRGCVRGGYYTRGKEFCVCEEGKFADLLGHR